MTQCTILNLCAVTALGLALLPDSAASQQRSIKEHLVGSWTIVSNDNVAPDGTKRQIFGANPNGLFILAADGRYALVVVNPARPKFKGSSRLDGTPEENKAAIAGTVAAFGTWSFDEATSTLVTSIEGSLFPNDEGRDQRRIIALAGDELKMLNPSPGSGGRAEIVFKRAK
jgi:Lipocalin-like domain